MEKKNKEFPNPKGRVRELRGKLELSDRRLRQPIGEGAMLRNREIVVNQGRKRPRGSDEYTLCSWGGRGTSKKLSTVSQETGRRMSNQSQPKAAFTGKGIIPKAPRKQALYSAFRGHHKNAKLQGKNHEDRLDRTDRHNRG